MKVSLLIRINGIVQGVGMRPFIYRIANELGIKGKVYNSPRGVEILVTGEEESINTFISNIKNSPPPASRIISIETEKIKLTDFEDFSIVHSSEDNEVTTSVSPDLCICEECRAELINRKDRRFLYPFINCTNCGPRYSIVQKVPYDRPNTTMKKFVMCENCQQEYENPSDRRFHAQPNACHSCGPQPFLKVKGEDKILSGYEAIKLTRRLLKDGKIVAIKGLGGFHIACDATNRESVCRLRDRKRKNMKPFAIMVPDLKTAERIAVISEQEKRMLKSVESPIVLLKKNKDYDLPEEISYENDYIGIMLPYTPLHTLLFYNPDTLDYDFFALVMTSGNIGELPIEYTNETAEMVLDNIVDAFLMHNRDIYNRIDDSIAYSFEDERIILRRARGFVPNPIIINRGLNESVLATGGELKGSFALNKFNQIIQSQHFGDLKTEEGMEFFIHTYKLLTDIFQIQPQTAILDKHPLYLTREIAKRLNIKNVYEVQHHYAHICSVLLENNYEKDVIGFAFDGTGYGDDGAIWGSEVFVCDLNNYKRRAHLKYVEMAGGDTASEFCFIPAISYLVASGVDPAEIDIYKRFEREKYELVLYSLSNKLNTFTTSSMGRLFDAVSFLLGIRDRNSFEGEAAMALEYYSKKDIKDFYSVNLYGDDEIEIDTSSLIKEIISDVKSHTECSIVAAKFHNYIVRLILEISKRIREESGISTVALSGGVFQNKYLLSQSVRNLRENNFIVLINRIVPPNDGGISFGQIGHYIYSRSS